MLRGVVYRLIEYLASMGYSSLWKLICAISVSNILTVGVHLSSTPSISGPGSATDCCTVWSPHTQEYINKLEMVQRRAARYVTNRYHNTSSVTSMLDHLEWESLEARRTKSQLTMMFKIINDLVNIPQEEYLTPASKRTRTRHSYKFQQISASSDYYLNSFFPKNVRLWNSLPTSG